jgi:hypothetical protein
MTESPDYQIPHRKIHKASDRAEEEPWGFETQAEEKPLRHHSRASKLELPYAFLSSFDYRLIDSFFIKKPEKGLSDQRTTYRLHKSLKISLINGDTVADHTPSMDQQYYQTQWQALRTEAPREIHQNGPDPTDSDNHSSNTIASAHDGRTAAGNG